MSPARLGLVVTAAVFAADQAVKALFLYGLGFIDYGPGEGIAALPFLNFVMVWNPGISYGLFPQETELGRWALIAFSLAVAGALSVWMARAATARLSVALALVVGGALGNVIDRIAYGAVADFFQLHAFGYSWYVFNVADAAIVFGVIALILDALLPARHGDAPQERP